MAPRRLSVLIGVLILAGCSGDSSNSPESAPSAGVEVVPAALEFGEVLMESSRSLEVTIHNTGPAQVEVTGIELSAGTCQDFEISSGPAAVSLAPDASVKVQVTYTPRSLERQEATLEIFTESEDDASNLSGTSGLVLAKDKPKKDVPIRGKGTTKPVPEVEVGPLAVDFGEVLAGSSEPAEISVRNVGAADLSVTRVALRAGSEASFDLRPAGWSGTIAPRASQAFSVSFLPDAGGVASGELLVESNDADESIVTVALSGAGIEVPSPEIDVAPIFLDFGEVMVGSQRSLSFAVKNAGTAVLDVTNVALGPGTTTEFSLEPAASSIAVAPGASASFQVLYLPVDLSSDSLTVRVESSDADEPSVTVSLYGTGIPVPAPEVDVAPLSLDFGDVTAGTFRDLTVTVRNVGTATLNVSSIAIAAASGSAFTVVSGPTSATLAPSASASVTVRYAPIDTASSSASLRISSNDPDEGLVGVSLAGRGIPIPVPEIEVSPLSLAFGNVVVGSSRTLSFSVKSTGTAALQVSGIHLGDGTGSEFAIASVPSSTQILPGTSAIVSVSYSPLAAASSAGAAVVESSDGDEPAVTVSLTGQGLPAPAPEINVSPLCLAFGETLLGGSSTLAVAASNAGTADLSISSISLDAGTSAAFSIAGGASTANLAPGQSASVTVSYAPTSEGIDQGSLIVLSSDAGEPRLAIPLTGSCVAPDPVSRSLTLAWDPPITNADGTPLQDLAGYKLYHGTASRQYSVVLDVGTATTVTLDSLSAGNIYLAVTAYDTSGNESDYSLEIWTTLE